MHPNKASGPDGMTPAFFQKHWHIVGEDIFNLTKQFLAIGDMPRSLNDTNIVLIPKKKNPTVLVDSSEAGNVVKLLRTYEKASGQQVNKEKSSIFYSSNVMNYKREAIIQVLRMPEANDHSTYLGLPTVIGRNKSSLLGHFSAPYTPQQNGVIDRRNRTVTAMVRSMLKETKMPAYLWGEVVRHTIYLLNYLPTRALSNKTPYEVNVRKLEHRSKAVVYLGKEPGTKASSLYDPISKRKMRVKKTTMLVLKVTKLDKKVTKMDKIKQSHHHNLDTPFLQKLNIVQRDYSQAVKELAWREAMQSEIDLIEKNNTWILTDLPHGHKAIRLKWVFKIKKDMDGEVVEHKARLVARGYVQRQAKHGWEVHHMDIKSAFLNGDIEEEVYVLQTEGFEKENQEQKLYKLLKALYGLKQNPRAWYTRLKRCLEKLRFQKCPYEQAVYTKREGNGFLVIGVYVDDLLIMGSSIENINKFKTQMKNEFDMSVLGKLSYYLGTEVEQRRGGIELKQSGYAKKLLEKAAGTQDHGLVYTENLGNHLLSGYSDSDLGAEFMASTATACQKVWLKNLLNQIMDMDVGPVVLYIDNRSAIDLAKNPFATHNIENAIENSCTPLSQQSLGTKMSSSPYVPDTSQISSQYLCPIHRYKTLLPSSRQLNSPKYLKYTTPPTHPAGTDILLNFSTSTSNRKQQQLKKSFPTQ
ncbi:hypothetical protein AgCh_002489 [Apium graveolens]